MNVIGQFKRALSRPDSRPWFALKMGAAMDPPHSLCHHLASISTSFSSYKYIAILNSNRHPCPHRLSQSVSASQNHEFSLIRQPSLHSAPLPALGPGNILSFTIPTSPSSSYMPRLPLLLACMLHHFSFYSLPQSLGSPACLFAASGLKFESLHKYLSSSQNTVKQSNAYRRYLTKTRTLTSD